MKIKTQKELNNRRNEELNIRKRKSHFLIQKNVIKLYHRNIRKEKWSTKVDYESVLPIEVFLVTIVLIVDVCVVAVKDNDHT